MTLLEGFRRTLRRLKRKPYVPDRRVKIGAIVERILACEIGGEAVKLMAIENPHDRIDRLLLRFFNGNSSKVELWWRTANPMLGNLSPKQMVMMGKAENLYRFIETQCSESDGGDEHG